MINGRYTFQNYEEIKPKKERERERE